MSEGLLLSFDEKKEDPPMSDMKEDPFDSSSAPLPSIALSPSKRRAKAASSAGLSELSKQLRILQAKNEAQSVEINRLERQLRILAELQGISVADLRKALEDACANEAFGELQNRVAKLRAELEAATLAKQKELRQDATAPHIANLELRVGELEEVEEKHQMEIHHLYEQLRHERARATRLQAEGAQHKQDAQDYLDRLNKEKARGNKLEATFQDQLQKYQLEQARKMQELAKMAKEAELRRLAMSKNGALNDPDGSEAVRSCGTDSTGVGATRGASHNGTNGQNASGMNDRRLSGSDLLGNGIDFGSFGIDIRGLSPEEALATIAPHMLAEHERMLKLLKEKEDALRAAQAQLQAEKDQWLKQQREAEEAARQAQLNLQMDKDKMSLTIKELADTESQNDLRLAQFKARFSVQDEHIADMEQQLDSLYTAFGIIKEEQDADEFKRAALQCNLNEADEEMAKQVHDEQSKEQNRSHVTTGSPQAARPQVVDPWDAVARGPSTPNAARSTSVPNTILTASPGWASPVVATPTRTPTVHSPRTSSSYQRSVALYSPSMASSRSRGMTTPTVTAQPYTTPPRTPGTWQLIFPEPHTTSTRSYDPSTPHNQDGLLIRGNLIVKSKSMMRKWKSKHCKLYLRGNHYQWDMEGKSYTLGFGISKVEYYPNHPLAFTVWTNPYDEMAPVIHAAASNEDDYNRWMGALTKATTGGEYTGNNQLVHRLSSSAASSSPSIHPSSAESVVSALSVEDQEAADLERALRLSETVM